MIWKPRNLREKVLQEYQAEIPRMVSHLKKLLLNARSKRSNFPFLHGTFKNGGCHLWLIASKKTLKVTWNLAK